MSSPQAAAPDGRTRSRGIVRIVGASLVGTTIEWYDFFLYGSAAALVFNKLFFPTDDPLVGTMIAFITYAIGFVARPLGGVVFGHFGDRIGRKKLLVLSLLMMGGSTFAMGLLPTYASIGVGAPLLLTLLRLIQGFALGGEWGGAVLIVSEHGGSEHRGFWASWPQSGAPGGNLLATAVLAILAAVQSDAAFLAWGWRVPFLLSGILVAVGLWVRLSISESPVFLAAQQQAEQEAAAGIIEKPPVVDVLRKSWRDVLTAIGTRFAENISYYILTAFLLVYVTSRLELSKSLALNAVLIASAIHFFAIPMWGALSDRIGRRPVTMIGSGGMAIWAFLFFTVVDSGSFAVITLAVTVGLLLHGAMYGPQAAFISELFDTKVRYSGASIGSQLASIVAGAVAPLIAVELLRDFDSSLPVSVYLCLAGLITTVTVFFARETRGSDLTRRVATAPTGAAAEEAKVSASSPAGNA